MAVDSDDESERRGRFNMSSNPRSSLVRCQLGLRRNKSPYSNANRHIPTFGQQSIFVALSLQKDTKIHRVLHLVLYA